MNLLRCFEGGVKILADMMACDNNFHPILDAYHDQQEAALTRNLFSFLIQKVIELGFDFYENDFFSVKTREKDKLFNECKLNYEKYKDQPLRLLKWLKKSLLANQNNCNTKSTELLKCILSPLQTHNLGKYYVSYIERLINKWDKSGNKFQKNDICDMIIIMSLNEDSSEIIVFDDNSYDFLKEINHPSINTIKKFYSR